MSWSDDTPQAVREDLDLLLDAGLFLAQSTLAEDGELFPVALLLGDDDERSVVAAESEDGSDLTAEQALETLYASAQADGVRAAAFISAVVIDRGEGGDGIRVELEHRDGGEPVAIIQPYRRAGLRRRWQFGELIGAPGTRRAL